MTLPLLVISGLIAAAFSPLIYRLHPKIAAVFAALWPATMAIYLGLAAPAILGGTPLEQDLAWVPGLGLSLSFYVDSLSLLFGLMVTVIGCVVIFYASAYLRGNVDLGRFYATLLVFMAAMVGVVCSGNLVAMFVFWELTGISSYLLIGFNHEKEGSRAAALQALLITTAGGLALMLGLLIMGWIAGSYQLNDLLQNGEIIREHALYLPILLLVLAGAFTKSAQFPFHFWLPQAMAAPTPISAYLHSATMVKLGVFLLARLYPVLAGTPEWHALVTVIGGITMVMGALRSPLQDDLKAILAYSTLSILGMLTFLLGLGGNLALKAMVVVIIAHALYKAPLFLVAGNLDHETGTRSIADLSGLRRHMPISFAMGLVAAISMIGLPPTLGFIGKEGLLEAALQASVPWAATLACIATGTGLAVAAWQAGIGPFLGKSQDKFVSVHEAPVSMWLGALLLAALGWLLGMLAGGITQTVVSAALGNLQPGDGYAKLALWHGLTPALFLSALILVMAACWIWFGKKLSLVPPSLPTSMRLSTLYQRGFESLLLFAGRVTKIIQSESPRQNLSIILFAFLLLGTATLVRLGGLPGPPDLEFRFLEGGLGLLMLVAAFAVIRARTMMTAAVLLGVIGFAMSAVFLIYGAVDLAITQIVVDTLTVLLFVLVVRKLPSFKSLSATDSRIRDALLATGVGSLVTLMILKADQVKIHDSISFFFNENSLPQAFGRNIVNVILVDFRALDTLGEITVLAAAAMGVYLLMRGSKGQQKAKKGRSQ